MSALFRRLTSARARARIALYGTIGLCLDTSLNTYSVQTALAHFGQRDDPARLSKWQKRRDELQEHYVCSRKNLSEGRYHTLVTSIWNHGSGIHLLGNMIGLWSFGRIFAYGFGAGTFLTIFYGGGIAGNLVCLALDQRFGKKDHNPLSKAIGQNRETGGFIGASGGVCALTAANACVNPFGTMIITFAFVPLPLPNAMGALGFAAFSAWAQTNGFEENVAHLGHLGGLLHGFLWFVFRYRGLPVI